MSMINGNELSLKPSGYTWHAFAITVDDHEDVCINTGDDKYVHLTHEQFVEVILFWMSKFQITLSQPITDDQLEAIQCKLAVLEAARSELLPLGNIISVDEDTLQLDIWQDDVQYNIQKDVVVHNDLGEE